MHDDTDSSSLPGLAPRASESHKGSYGRVLVVGGSIGFTGAAILAASGVLRSGAGLVTVGVPSRVADLVPIAQPCAMTLPLPDDDGRFVAAAAEPILDFASRCDALVIGPGLGRSDDARELVRHMLAQLPCTAVFDADALVAIGDDVDRWRDAPQPVVLTPHPGEMAMLDPASDSASSQNHEARRERARAFAERTGCIVALKGHRTVVSDGTRHFVNTTGNPGMATGGTGDVLAGVIAALVGQGLAPFDAAGLGVHVHGIAGDLAAAHHGEVSMIASDLLDSLGPAFLQHAQASTSGGEGNA